MTDRAPVTSQNDLCSIEDRFELQSSLDIEFAGGTKRYIGIQNLVAIAYINRNFKRRPQS